MDRDEDKVSRQDTNSVLAEPPPHHVTGWLDVVTVHVNDHLRFYRTVSWVVGSVGVVLLLKFTRAPVKQFRQVSSIPSEYVINNTMISGVVAATKWNTIGVWHVPAWRRVVQYQIQPPSECILVNFGHVTC